METIGWIIIVLIAIAFWERILTGIVGAVIFGFIGSFFGGAGTKIGIMLGFIIGISSKEDANKKEEKENSTDSNNKEKSSSTKSHKSSNPSSHKTKIVRCPSCKKKIRVKLPLRGNKGKCVACSTSFSIKVDENGNLIVGKIKAENGTGSHHGSMPVSEHFKILEIEPTATPKEVKAAYRKKIREYHPDRVAGLGDKLKKMADEESKAINKYPHRNICSHH